METSNQTSPAQSPKVSRIRRVPRVDTIGAIFFLILGVIGFLDATYLSLEHYRGVIPVCKVVTGCGQVLLSQYSMIGPVPLSVVGMLYYTVVIAGSIMFLDLKRITILHRLADYTLVGILASGYFMYLQLFVIKALCLYCIFSALTSTLLFANGVFIYKKTLPKKSA